VQAGPPQQVLDVRAYRVAGDKELLCDLAGRHRPDQALEDISLTRREFIGQGARLLAGLLVEQQLQHAVQRPPDQCEMARARCPDRSQETVVVDVLADPAVDAGA
jgi:hypothetical protein